MPCDGSDVVTATDALLAYLAAKHPGSRVLAVAESVVQAALREAGHQVTDDPAEADVVVVSFDRTFDYGKLTRAYRAVDAGAVLVATNPDPYCPNAGRRPAGLCCDARGRRGVHRGPGRSGRRKAKRAYGQTIVDTARLAARCCHGRRPAITDVTMGRTPEWPPSSCSRGATAAVDLDSATCRRSDDDVVDDLSH